MNNYKKYGLEAPSIPVAGVDGVIKTVDLPAGIPIYFPQPVGAQPNDSYQLLINGVLAGNKELFPDPISEIGSTLTLIIHDTSDIENDGVYLIGYQIKPFPGLTPQDSAMTKIYIDRTPPGAAVLAPIIFPNVTFGDALIGLIPGYAGMQQGDVIQTVCNEMNGPTVTLADAHLTTSPVIIRFEREFLQNVGSDEIVFSYLVTDRAGNVSRLSEPVELVLTINHD